MTLTGDTWTMWRAAPGFHQRFTATVARATITGRWERSQDSSSWFTDFDLTCTRVT